ncbi:MAG: hypothetical protein QNJ37_18065 [Crocosphaera sp.]|nr:hypothetical protein [Crocosphaera sp.]
MDPFTISWLIGSFIAGAAIGYFWDEIKEWATQVISNILDSINRAIEITSDAMVYLVKQGSRVYERVEIYVRNRMTGETKLRYKEKEIPRSDIPDEVEEQFKQKSKVPVLQYET